MQVVASDAKRHFRASRIQLLMRARWSCIVSSMCKIVNRDNCLDGSSHGDSCLRCDVAAFQRPAARARPMRLQHASRRAITLIELIVFMLFIGCAALGGSIGWKMALGMGHWWQMGGMLLGAVAGGAAVIASIFLLALPFEIYAAVRRALQPADLICRCRDPNLPVPDHLLPS